MEALQRVAGKPCRQLRHRRQTGIKPIGRRAIGILCILQGLTICGFFLRVRTSFGCLERNVQTTEGVCEQYTHKYSTCRVAQHDRSHFITRTRVAQELQSSKLNIVVSLKQFVIHVSCLIPCRTRPPIHTRPLVHDEYLPCHVPRQSGGSTQILLTHFIPLVLLIFSWEVSLTFITRIEK